MEDCSSYADTQLPDDAVKEVTQMPKEPINHGVTVEMLLNTLKDYPKNMRVVLSGDSEGNHYGDPGVYEPEDGKDGGKVLTLFPINHLMDEDIFKL
jgi:hypothetical protein